MIVKILAIVFLIILFLFLSKSADLIVLNIRKIGEKLGINIFFLGIILGIITSLPEMAIGLNSVINDVAIISFGHLMGGIIVLLGLVLPISIILNRTINTEKNSWPFLVILLFFFFPLILSLKGQLAFLDGIILMVAYVLLIIYLFKNKKNENRISVNIIDKKETRNSFIYIIIGLVGIILSSELIVKTTLFILKDYNISLFAVGLLLYPIGTNLPELTIAIRSFKRKVKELSFSNLIGAAMAHVLILGFLSSTKTIGVEISSSYIFLILFSLIFFTILYIFYKTDRLLSRLEGFILLFMYFLFVSVEIFMQIWR